MSQHHPKRVAYLGPPGTFGEEAALRYAPDAQLLHFPSHAAVAQAVASGMAGEGVVAIENSLEGAVTETLDLLIHESQLAIYYEIVLPIVHCLLVKPGTDVAEMEVIFSHPQALGQGRRFIERCFPKAQPVAAMSTAAAVELMLERRKAAAISTLRAAEIYGAEVMARGIQDGSTNVTRFVVLAPTDHEPTGRDKTSLCFAFTEDKPGILVRVLQAFSSRGINLAKIESRPSRESLGKYIFLADLEGHRLDPPVKSALEEIAALTDPQRLKIFGSYPRYNDNGA